MVIFGNKTVILQANDPRLKLLYLELKNVPVHCLVKCIFCDFWCEQCIQFKEAVKEVYLIYQTCNKHLKIEIIINNYSSFSALDLCRVYVLCFSTNEESHHLFRANDG